MGGVTLTVSDFRFGFLVLTFKIRVCVCLCVRVCVCVMSLNCCTMIGQERTMQRPGTRPFTTETWIGCVNLMVRTNRFVDR